MANKIEQRKITDLIPYINNSRTHSDGQVNQIVASIKEFGFTNPVLIDGNNGIIAGHGRVQAAIVLGLQDIDVISLSHLSEAQKKAYIIADNKLALNAGWDDEMLKVEMERLRELDFDLELTGFSDDEIDKLVGNDNVGLTDDDAVPDIPLESITNRGDVWLLGKHRMMCGDSTSEDDAATLMNGVLADQLITDPPYNVAYEGKTAEGLTIQNDEMDDEDFAKFLTDCFTNAKNCMKEGAVFYIWHADSEGYNFRQACKLAGLLVRQCLIWNKNSMVMGRQDYHCKHEPCLYGWKDGSAHLWNTDRKQTTVLDFSRPTANKIHPTMKPVDLIEYQILNNTKGSDIVLDLFGGSGSTMIACEKNRRICHSMELDEKYCDVAIKRWQDYTGEIAVLESSGKQFTSLVD